MEVSKEQKVFRQVVEKAWNDPAFKSELIASPEATIESLTGETVTVPEGKELVVVDHSDASKVYFAIPPRPNYDEMELSDEQLEMVAGGEFFLGSAIISGLVSLSIGVLVGE